MTQRFHFKSLLLVVVISAAPALATDLPAPIFSGSVDKGIGLLAVYAPDFEGSEDYEFLPAPVGFWKFGQGQFALLAANNLFVNLLNNPNFELGPKATIRGGRDDVDDDVVDDLEDVDPALELGAFVGYKRVLNGDPRNRLIIRSSISQDVTDEHDGFVFDAFTLYWVPIADKLDFGLRGGISLASDDYHEAFFDVTAEDSAVTGLPEYSADGGVKDLSGGLMLMYHLNESWILMGGVIYKRLLGDAEDSPIVDDRGDANQVLSTIGAAYIW